MVDIYQMIGIVSYESITCASSNQPRQLEMVIQCMYVYDKLAHRLVRVYVSLVIASIINEIYFIIQFFSTGCSHLLLNDILGHDCPRLIRCQLLTLLCIKKKNILWMIYLTSLILFIILI